MASGTGAFGATSQCYRFWIGFSECRESTNDPRLCLPERVDYMECLTRENLKKRITEKAIEVQKQRAAASAPPAAPGHH